MRRAVAPQEEAQAEKKESFWYSVDRRGDKELKWGHIIPSILGGILLVILLAVGWPLTSVGPTERGVRVTFGKVDESQVLMPGLVFKIPFVQRIQKYDLTPQKVTIDISIGTNAAISMDKQEIGVKGEGLWKFNEDAILQIATSYASVSKLQSDVGNILMTAVKNTIGQYNIDTIARDQGKVASDAIVTATNNLMLAGIPATITIINLNNWDWTDDYNDMIKQTQNMAQQAEKAKQELAMVEQTSQKQVKEAEAAAAAAKAAADANLYVTQQRALAIQAEAEGEKNATIARAQGVAEQNRLIQQNLAMMQAQWKHDEQMAYYERWNGVEVSTYLPLTAAGGLVTLPGSK